MTALTTILYILIMTAPSITFAANPSLLSLTLSHLGKSDLATCLRVSMTFFDVVGPLLYRQLDIDCTRTFTAIDRASLTTRRRKKVADRFRAKQILLNHTRLIDLRDPPRHLQDRWAADDLNFPRLEALRLYGLCDDSAQAFNAELNAIQSLRPRSIIVRPLGWRDMEKYQIARCFKYLTDNPDHHRVERIILVDLGCDDLLNILLAALYHGCDIPVTVVLPYNKSEN